MFGVGPLLSPTGSVQFLNPLLGTENLSTGVMAIARIEVVFGVVVFFFFLRHASLGEYDCEPLLLGASPPHAGTHAHSDPDITSCMMETVMVSPVPPQVRWRGWRDGKSDAASRTRPPV